MFLCRSGGAVAGLSTGAIPHWFPISLPNSGFLQEIHTHLSRPVRGHFQVLLTISPHYKGTGQSEALCPLKHWRKRRLGQVRKASDRGPIFSPPRTKLHTPAPIQGHFLARVFESKEFGDPLATPHRCSVTCSLPRVEVKQSFLSLVSLLPTVKRMAWIG